MDKDNRNHLSELEDIVSELQSLSKKTAGQRRGSFKGKGTNEESKAIWLYE